MALTGCWIVTDLDGTLVPTPHKANGRYIALGEDGNIGSSSSSEKRHCTLPYLQKWLLQGGNIVVITTADFRVLGQVYLPLRDTLIECRKRGMTADEKYCCGQLLISAFSGAALFSGEPCLDGSLSLVSSAAATAVAAAEKSSSIAEEQKKQAQQKKRAGFTPLDYGRWRVECKHPSSSIMTVQQLLRKEVVLVPNYIQINKTALSSSLTEKGLNLLKDLFFQYAMEVLLVDDSSLELLSGRYRKMWRTIVARLLFSNRGDSSRVATTTTTSGGPHSSAADVRPLVSIERGDSDPMNPHNEAGGKENGGTGAVKDQMKKRERAMAVLADLTKLGEDEKLRQFEQQFKKGKRKVSFVDVIPFEQRRIALERLKLEHDILAALVSARIVTETFPNGNKSKHVVQLLLVGVPMKMSQQYLKFRANQLQSFGLRPIAQPNSVVISVDDVTKGTAVRFLSKDHYEEVLENFQSAGSSAPTEAADDGVPPLVTNNEETVTKITKFAGKMNLDRAVALGDTPQSGDKHLTLFSPMQFISLQKDDHAFNLGLFVRAVTQRHIHHVGHEEVGGTLFLKLFLELMMKTRGATQDQRKVISTANFQHLVRDASKIAAHLARGNGAGGGKDLVNGRSKL